MVARNPLVLVAGVPAELPPGDTVNGAVGSAPSFTQVEVNLGTNAEESGTFTIAGVGLTIGKPVQIFQAAAAYTGKGTLTDEPEFDQLLATGVVVSAVLIRVYWRSTGLTGGNVKFNYIVGA